MARLPDLLQNVQERSDALRERRVFLELWMTAEMNQQTEIDEIWRRDGERNGWRLPTAAPIFLRLMGIRLVRAAIAEKRARNEAVSLKKQGVGLGNPPQQELWVIYAIARGWC